MTKEQKEELILYQAEDGITKTEVLLENESCFANPSSTGCSEIPNNH